MRTFVLTMTLLGSVAIAGCNTVSGVGEDIQQGGQAIERTAEDVKTGTY